MYSDAEAGATGEYAPRDLWPEVRARLRAFDLLNEDDSPKKDGPMIRVMEKQFDPAPNRHGKTLIFARTGKLIEVTPRGFGEDGKMGRIVIDQEGTLHPIGFTEIDQIELP